MLIYRWKNSLSSTKCIGTSSSYAEINFKQVLEFQSMKVEGLVRIYKITENCGKQFYQYFYNGHLIRQLLYLYSLENAN